MSNTPGPDDEAAERAREYQALLQFVHQAPVGLIQIEADGRIVMMNPMATQLLGPLGFGNPERTGADVNLFDVLDPHSPDIRRLAQSFAPTNGVLCDNFRVVLSDEDLPPEAPIALAFTMAQLRAAGGRLMVVITDDSAGLRLQRLRANWR